MLNSHLPLSEGIGDTLNPSAQQLQAIEVVRKERNRTNMAKASKAAYEREREQDLEIPPSEPHRKSSMGS